jgi:hypothetical protein
MPARDFLIHRPLTEIRVAALALCGSFTQEVPR